MKLEMKHVSSILEDASIDILAIEQHPTLGIVVRIRPEDNKKTMYALRDGANKFEMLLDVFGADMAEDEEIEVTYHLRSFETDSDVRIKMRIPHEGEYHSVIDVYLSVQMAERELCEMYGLYLEGHPNPKRLLTNLGYINPLLKSTPIRGKEEIWALYQ